MSLDLFPGAAYDINLVWQKVKGNDDSGAFEEEEALLQGVEDVSPTSQVNASYACAHSRGSSLQL